MLEIYLEARNCPQNSQTCEDIAKIRRAAGYFVRICDEVPLSTLKFEKAANEIRSLRHLIFNPRRLAPVVDECLLGMATWEYLQHFPFIVFMIDKFSKKKLQQLFKKYFVANNGYFRSQFETLLEVTSNKLKEWELASNDNILDVFFNKVHGIDLGFVPKAFSDSLKIFLVKYFNSIDFYIKKNLIAALIEMPPGTPITKAFFVALKECGPTLQKIFQLLMDEVANQDLNDIHVALKTLCNQMSVEDLVKVFLVAFDGQDKFFQVFERFNFNAVASATVAQGHHAWLKGDNQLVFVKIKKYQIEHKMRLDFELMHQVAIEHPQYQGIYQELQENLMAEMNWERELDNMRKATAIYHQPIYGIHVPQIFSFYPQRNPQIIVMECIQGTPLIPFVPKSKEHCCRLVGHLKSFYKIWWNEAVYGSGFMHGDVHGGNLMYQFDEKNPEQSRLYVIDYGNTKELDAFSRESVIEIALGVYLNDPVAVANGLGRLRYPEKTKLWRDFICRLRVFMNSPSVRNTDKDERIPMIIKYITGTFDLPSAKDILIFFRAKGLFDGVFKYLENNYGPLLQEYGCPIPKTNALARDVAFWSLKNLYRSAVYGRRPIMRLAYRPIMHVSRMAVNFFRNLFTKYNGVKEKYEILKEYSAESTDVEEQSTEMTDLEETETSDVFEKGTELSEINGIEERLETSEINVDNKLAGSNELIDVATTEKSKEQTKLKELSDIHVSSELVEFQEPANSNYTPIIQEFSDTKEPANPNYTPIIQESSDTKEPADSNETPEPQEPTNSENPEKNQIPIELKEMFDVIKSIFNYDMYSDADYCRAVFEKNLTCISDESDASLSDSSEFSADPDEYDESPAEYDESNESTTDCDESNESPIHSDESSKSLTDYGKLEDFTQSNYPSVNSDDESNEPLLRGHLSNDNEYTQDFQTAYTHDSNNEIN